MQDAVYHQYAQTFDTHWWADHRRKFISRWLRELGVTADGTQRVLETGCGAGTEHAYLRQYGPVTGVELSETGLEYCRKRGYAELLSADLNAVQLPVEQFDLAVDFHVLYHEWVRDPGAVLQRMRAALKPGGRLIMSEPAYELLRREHDTTVMAARRWTRGDLLHLVRSAGFEVERCSGFLTLLFPAVLLSVVIDRLLPKAHTSDDGVGELQPPHPVVDHVLRAVMAVERWLMRVHALPFGTCWAVIARRN